ncbi:DUF2975 domain-containing protein [Alkalicoccobacillus porphyridii]|uniref:DUF2975 domain-containing protein n=1 Tax=Alkalicoccobacillus porphyridii TaxID=2597270 RepID=A0A553ZTN8_9BACI|nr:DUF2975 domain-containing protein [Alkalicoccobacillus porphyridii]TSB44832.1 DUF2975 domain-containing protein [Alkalicoccobacillus porphyridii]
MKRETLFLKVAVFLIGAPVLALCIFWVPLIASQASIFYPTLAHWRFLVMAGLYITAVAFFIALYQAIKLLRYIDKNETFTNGAIQALTHITTCAVVISGCYVLSLPIFYLVAEADDAPGIIVLGLVILFASTVIAVFAAVLKKLLKNAIEIKSENDLTV